MKRISVLGSTGSIGRNSLDIISMHPELFKVQALCAYSDSETLHRQAAFFSPEYISVAGTDHSDLSERFKTGFGTESVIEACENSDLVIIGIAGIAGLKPFVHCLINGIPVALATKEALVCGGRFIRELMDSSSAPVYPLDTELSAIFQCLRGRNREDIKKVLLTASGGPFRTWDAEKIASATVDEVMKHPTWKMGPKITVDCATMANKGLEIMETRWMFNVSPEIIDVVVHPQSVIHSMLEFKDNSLMAQLAYPDQRIPISYALTYPEVVQSDTMELDLFSLKNISFEKPDLNKFPCLGLALEAVRHDGAIQLVFCSANEMAVEMFLDGRVRFSDISGIIEKSMMKFSNVNFGSIDEIYEIDREVKAFASFLKQG